MSKPRVFLSSTCFDLGDVRARLTEFFESRGFEVLNSQKRGRFGVSPRKHAHKSCLGEVSNSDYLVLIIGARSGAKFVNSRNSITNEEFKLAQRLHLPTIVFAKKTVLNALPFYKKNPNGDFSSVVDDKRVFHFIDYVASGHEDNWIHDFDDVEDIVEAINGLLAHFLLNYSQSIRVNESEKVEDNTVLAALPTAMPFLDDNVEDQDGVASYRAGVKLLYDVIEAIATSDTARSRKEEKLRTLWVFGNHDENEHEDHLRVKQPIFKDHAWSYQKASRVFTSMNPLGLRGDFEEPSYGDDNPAPTFTLRYRRGEAAQNFADALRLVCKELSKELGSRDGFKAFMQADFRFLAS